MVSNILIISPPDPWGFMIQIDERTYFSNGLVVQPATFRHPGGDEPASWGGSSIQLVGSFMVMPRCFPLMHLFFLAQDSDSTKGIMRLITQNVVFVGRFILGISIMISWVTSTCTVDPFGQGPCGH